MAWTALRSKEPDSVVREVCRYFVQHNATLTTLAPDPWSVSSEKDAPEDDILIFDRIPWIVIQWPYGFDGYDLRATVFLTRELGCLASTNSIHCDDLWRHALVENGVVLDLFANKPTYFCNSNTNAKAKLLRRRYKGNPDRVARAIGASPAIVRRYFVHLPLEKPSKPALRDDKYVLGSPWAFGELWKRIGIDIPIDGKRCIARLSPAEDYEKKLPANSEGF